MNDTTILDKEAMKKLLCNIVSESSEDDYIVKMDFHKILYLLKEKLPEDNDVKEMLPFYWYKHGPMSDVIKEEIVNLEKERFLEAETEGRAKRFTMGNKNISNDINSPELEKALHLLRMILGDYEFHKERRKILKDKIYSSAPYQFQSYYKFQLYPALSKIQRGLSQFLPQSQYEDIFASLSKAEMKLPLEKDFRQFNKVFSRFSTLAEQSLKYLHKTHLSSVQAYLSEIGEKIWDVFCKKLRTVKYDPYYEKKVKYWEKIYRSAYAQLKTMIAEFETFVIENLDSELVDSFTPVPAESAWGVIVEKLFQNE